MASKFLSPFTKTQTQALLHGVGVMICECGCGKEDLIIPCIGNLLSLAHDHPECMEFVWDDQEKQWRCLFLN